MRRTLTIVPRFLRDPKAFYESIQRGEEIGAKAFALIVSSILFLVAYGFVTGLSHSLLQALSSAVKMPLLFVITMAFCLPALYFFALALLGTQLSVMQVTAVVLSGIGVTAFLLLGLSPVTLFFVLTSKSYPFFQLLAVVFVAVSGCIGLYYLWRGMTWVDSDRENAMGTIGRTLLGAWAMLYAFVGAQMTWRLSPLIGDPDLPFVLLQPSRDNFFVDAIRAFERATGVSQSPSSWEGIVWTLSCMGGLFVFVVGMGVFIGSRKRRDDSSSSK